MNNEKFQRLTPIFTQEGLEKLQNKKVLILGVGGVGGFVCEAIARTGIKHIGICDGDIVEYSNFNRQIIATDDMYQVLKTIAMEKRIHSFNDEIEVITYPFFIDENTISKINFKDYDIVLDCIDDVNAKVLIIEKCKNENVEIISCMGTANKTDPNGFKIADINQTSYCPLAKRVRTELRKKGISKVKVCYSNEIPLKNDQNILASQIFIVGSAGFVIATEAIKILTTL